MKTTPAGAVDSTGSLYDVQLDTPKVAAGAEDTSTKKKATTTTTNKDKEEESEMAAKDDASAGVSGVSGDDDGGENRLDTVHIDFELVDGMMEAVENVTAAAATASSSSAPTTPVIAPAADAAAENNSENIKKKATTRKTAAAVEEEEADPVEPVLDEKKDQNRDHNVVQATEEATKVGDEEKEAANADSDDTGPFPEKKKTKHAKEDEKQQGEAKVDPESLSEKEPETKKKKVEGKGVLHVFSKNKNKYKDKKDEGGGGGKDDDAKSDSSGYASTAYSDDEGGGEKESSSSPSAAAAAAAITSTTTPPQTSTKDANQSEVQGRAKDSPPPTPRIRGTPSSSPQLSPHLSSGMGMPGAVSTSSSSSRLGGGGSSPSEASGWTSVVVLYTTSMSTVRKTAGQCQRVKQTLANLGVEFLERDISMAVAYKEELKKRLSTVVAGENTSAPAAPVPPLVPYLFIDDEKIAGGDDLDDMAAEGYLKELLLEKGRTSKKAATSACAGCGGKRLVICPKCHGSMRLVMTEQHSGKEVERRCPWCNEVGMTECEVCVPKFARTSSVGKK